MIPAFGNGSRCGGSILRDGALAGPGHVAVAGLGPEMERRRKALLYCLHLRSLRNDAVLGVTPKDDEKLAGQCHDHDLLDSATGFADPFAELKPTRCCQAASGATARRVPPSPL